MSVIHYTPPWKGKKKEIKKSKTSKQQTKQTNRRREGVIPTRGAVPDGPCQSPPSKKTA